MSLDKYFTAKILGYMRKGGAFAIFLVAFGLFFNYYEVINLDNIPFPGLTLILWLYLIINAGIATPFHYIKERRENISQCPKCGEPLRFIPEFHCPSCGKLKFEKNEKNL